MTGNLEGINKEIAIIGFINVKLENPDRFLEQFRKENKGAPVQFFDAKHVAGTQHLYFAALNALNAFEKNTNISNNIEVEALLYASGQRQIQKAVKLLGIRQDTSEVAALIITDDDNKKTDCINRVSKIVPGERDDSVIELTDKKLQKIRKRFSISDIEFDAKLKKEGLEKEALTDLVIERMALLVTKS